MTTYVLGAGASYDAGYPLARTMALDLFHWMKNSAYDLGSYEARYPDTARFLERLFAPVENIEDLITAIEELIAEYEEGSQEQREQRVLVVNGYEVLKNAIRSWFVEIQHGSALDSVVYRQFAKDVVLYGDTIITFNYDVSLDRELHLAGKFEVGDGYGFTINSLPTNSPVKVLKLHGSTSWLAFLFGGMTSGFSAFQPGSTLGDRPVIPKNDLSFLGYEDSVDPRFSRGGAALQVMIYPGRAKKFYFNPNTGIEYVEFWDNLWRLAASALLSSSRIVLCGYSLPAADARARQLLLNGELREAEIIIASGKDSERIAQELAQSGCPCATAAKEPFFKAWVNSRTAAPATESSD